MTKFSSKTIMKAYLKIVFFLGYIIFSFGFLLPYLVSSKSDMLPFVGMLYTITIPIISYYIIAHTINNYKIETKNNKKSQSQSQSQSK